jgi:hypothetical protein
MLHVLFFKRNLDYFLCYACLHLHSNQIIRFQIRILHELANSDDDEDLQVDQEMNFILTNFIQISFYLSL